MSSKVSMTSHVCVISDIQDDASWAPFRCFHVWSGGRNDAASMAAITEWFSSHVMECRP